MLQWALCRRRLLLRLAAIVAVVELGLLVGDALPSDGPLELEVSPNKVELGFGFPLPFPVSIAGAASKIRPVRVGFAPLCARSGATATGGRSGAPPRPCRLIPRPIPARMDSTGYNRRRATAKKPASTPSPRDYSRLMHTPALALLPCYTICSRQRRHLRQASRSSPLHHRRRMKTDIHRSSALSHLQCKVLQIAILNCILYSRRGHVDPVVRVELQVPPRQLFEFLRCDDGTHVRLCLSPVKHLRDLRLQAHQPQVQSPCRQPEGPPAGQAVRTSEVQDRCHRRGYLPESSLSGNTAGPRRLHLPLLFIITKFDFQSEMPSSSLSFGSKWVHHREIPLLNAVAQELQKCNLGILKSLHHVLWFHL